MAKNRKGLPDLINLGPAGMYQLVIFKIHNKYEDGKPEDCTMLPDEQVVELTGDEEFMTAYVPKIMLKGV